MAGTCGEPWSAESSLARYEMGFVAQMLGAQLLLPYRLSETFALIPKLASEQDAPRAIGSCGAVARLFLAPATPDPCLGKRVARAAEGLDKPGLLAQH